MFFTKEWLERRYSYVVYRRGSGYLGVQISSGGRNRQGVQPGFPGISPKYASYGMERTGSFLLVAGMPGWHPGSAGRLRPRSGAGHRHGRPDARSGGPGRRRQGAAPRHPVERRPHRQTDRLFKQGNRPRDPEQIHRQHRFRRIHRPQDPVDEGERA